MGNRSFLERMVDTGVKDSRILRSIKIEREQKHKRRRASIEMMAGFQEHDNSFQKKDNRAPHPAQALEFPYRTINYNVGVTYVIDPILSGHAVMYKIGGVTLAQFGLPVDYYPIGDNRVLVTISTEWLKSIGGIYAGRPIQFK